MPSDDPALLPCVEMQTGEQAAHTVIWLHGLGADGHDFKPVIDLFDSGSLPPTRFVFPHAPQRPVTINGGAMMRAWYDIVSPDFAQLSEDPQGVRESAAQLDALIARENARGFEDDHIVVAGFSQGGAIALHVGLRHPRRLAGILALSTYLPLADTVEQEAHPANREVPIFMAHGREDMVIPFRFAEQSHDRLQAAGYDVDWRTYRGEHGLTMEEIRDIEQWLATRFERC